MRPNCNLLVARVEDLGREYSAPLSERAAQHFSKDSFPGPLVAEVGAISMTASSAPVAALSFPRSVADATQLPAVAKASRTQARIIWVSLC